jgi:O-antigen ligase
VEIGLLVILVVDLAVPRGGMRLKLPTGPRMSRRVVAMLLLAGVSQALIGIWQFGLRGSGPEHFAVGGGAFYRAYGTFEQPNPYGGFMSWMLLLAIGTLLGLVAALRRGRMRADLRTSWPWWLFIIASASLTAVALVFSWSRGAWLAFTAGGAVLLFFLPRDRRIGFALLLAVGLLLFVAWQADFIPQPVIARLSSFTADLRFGDVRGVEINEANYAVIERLAHWQAAINMARDQFWLGVGFGNYEPAYAAYALPNWPFPLGHAHNYYLNLLAEVGLVGTVAYALLWVTIFLQTILLVRRLPWPTRGIALGLLAAWTALSVHHLLDKLYVNNLYLHLGVMLGLLQIMWWDVEKKIGA